jgi:5-methylcytosine-specific restriction endonuclease McrA
MTRTYTDCMDCQTTIETTYDPNKKRCPSCGKKMRGSEYRNVREIALEIAGHKCSSIDCDGEKLECHHKRLISWGGDNSLKNLQILCQECHREEHRTIRMYVKLGQHLAALERC